jgi:hypothetical protein
VDSLDILNIGGWITLLFYFIYKWMWRNDNRMGLRIVVISYLLLLIVISVWSLWWSLFIE